MELGAEGKIHWATLHWAEYGGNGRKSVYRRWDRIHSGDGGEGYGRGFMTGMRGMMGGGL